MLIVREGHINNASSSARDDAGIKAGHYKFGNRNNNEHLFINLARFRLNEFQILVLRQDLEVSDNLITSLATINCLEI